MSPDNFEAEQEITDFEDGMHGNVSIRLETYMDLRCSICGHHGRAETVQSIRRFLTKHNIGPHQKRGTGGKVQPI